MKDMTLRNVAAACGGRLMLTERASASHVGEETEIGSVVRDSREVTGGALFVAICGERVDGHSFAAAVYEKGAVCVLTEKTPERTKEEHGIAPDAWGAYILVGNTLQALRRIAEFYRSTLSIPVVGITGSVGKTSTKEFIAGVLARRYRVLKTEGNYNNEIGVPLTLLRIREEHQAAVVEMGISDFGEMHRLSRMARPDICVITNIGYCHLENLGDRDGVLRAKSEIFDFMAPDGAVCLNGEDDKLAAVGQVHGKPVHYFGLGGNPAEEVYAADIVSEGLSGSRAVLHTGAGTEEEETLEISVPLPGAHMVINAAAAACVGRLLGLTKEEIAEGIASVETVAGRSRTIRLKDHVLIDDCYNANPVSMRAAIDLLSTAPGAKAAILGDMFELGEESEKLHFETGKYAAGSGLDVIVCIGKSAELLYRGAAEACAEGGHTAKLFHYAEKEAFLADLAARKEALLPEGSTILIKASHGMDFAKLIRDFQENTSLYF